MVTPIDPPPAFARGHLLGRRFRLSRALEAGRPVETWIAEDLAEGRPVVVKLASIARAPRSVASRLRHEAEVLRSLCSPYLTPLIDAGVDEGVTFFAMPLVPGQTLAAVLAHGPLSAEDTLELARCVLGALVEAHNHGIVHRDLKPDNIVVTGRSPLEAVVLDFGLARSALLDTSRTEQHAGTVRYISPEAAGLLEADVDERADLYSLGVILFEALAGRPPFEGPSVTELLRQHLSSRPLDLRTVRAGIPRVLNDLVHRLLRKDPRDRYQSAASALADVRQLLGATSRGEREPTLVLGLADRRRSITEPAFVGRGRELAELEAHLAASRAGRVTLVRLAAPSGAGKTRLLLELAHRTAASAWILRGGGLAAVAPRPFQALAGVIEDLGAAALRSPALSARLSSTLAEYRGSLLAVFPELAATLGEATPEDLGPEATGEARTIQALEALLEGLGTPEHPALVMLDDCQWADQGTLRLLTALDAHGPRSGNLCVIAAYRSDEVDAGHALRGLGRAVDVEPSPLDAEQIESLVASMAGGLPPEATEVIVELAGGSPFMASAVMRGLVENGALCPAEEGWRVEPESLASARSSRRAALFLTRRLELLPETTREILTIGAVLGREFDLDLASTLGGQPSEVVIPAIDGARRRQLIWTKAHGARCVFVHDKLRESLLGALPEDRRRELHGAAARHIEAEDPSRCFELAYHFDAAGDPKSAAPYAMEAGARARARHALEVAERQLGIAARGLDPGDRVARLKVHEELGDVLMLRGSYERAGEELRCAEEHAESPEERARIRGKLGELAFKRGDVTEAGRALESAARTLGHTIPENRYLLALAVLWEVLVQAAHTCLPGLFLARRSLEGRTRALLQLHLYSRLAHVYWFGRGKVACLWAHLRELNLAERYEPSRALAQAYSEHAPVMTMVPWFSRGIHYARRSYEIRRDLGDVWGQGQSLHFLGIVLYAASRFEESLSNLREAVRLLERTGDRWEINTASWHIAYCLYRLGRTREAIEAAEHVHGSGLAIGDAQATGISLSVWSKASRGAVPEAALAAGLARDSRDVHTRAEVLQATAIRALAVGQLGEAERLLEDAQRKVDAAGLVQEYVAPILPWLATVHRSKAEAISMDAPRRRRVALRTARRTARRALRVARVYRNNLPHAEREAGLIAAMAGRTEEAQRRLDRAVGLARELGMNGELLESLRARARVTEANEVSGAARDREEAAQLACAVEPPRREEEPEAPTISLQDRFRGVISAGQRITSATTRTEVLAATRQAAIELLRGEELALVPVEPDPGVEPAPLPVSRGRISRVLIDRALTSGRPVSITDTSSDSATDSVVLLPARSLLAAPILVHDKARWILAVAHDGVGGLFGPADEQIAELITAIAGASLENAEGLENTQAVAEERARLYEASQAALRVRDEFLQIASHELKTPLTALTLEMQSLARRAADHRPGSTEPNLTARFARLERQVARLRKLVEDLLDVSRITSGHLTLSAEPFDLAEMVRDVVLRFHEALEAARCPVELRLDEGAVGLWDRSRIDQAVTNLLSNAMKFGAGRPIEISVGVSREGAPRAQLSVQDHGIGIDDGDQERIFARFERAESARHYGGLGLGLWITRRIVESHEGTIGVSSLRGCGARFTIELPLRSATGASSG